MGPHWGGGAHARNRLMPNQPVRQRASEASSLLSPLTLCVSLYVWERMRVCVCTHSAQFNLPPRGFNYQRASETHTSHRIENNSVSEIIARNLFIKIIILKRINMEPSC